MSIRWLAASYENGALAARVGRDGADLVAEWAGRARLRAKPDGSGAVFEPLPGAPAREVDKVRRGPARLLLLHLAGGIPLHGAAVAIDGRAVVLVGAAGAGKSTLAASLCARAGASLLGDDAVAIERIERAGEGYEVVALEIASWLDAGAARAVGRAAETVDAGDAGDAGDASDKSPYAAPRCDVERARLALVVELAFAELGAPRVTTLEGLDAASALLRQLTRFVIEEPDVARRDLAALADLVDRTPIVRLERPRQLDGLDETTHFVVRTLRAIPGQ